MQPEASDGIFLPDPRRPGTFVKRAIAPLGPTPPPHGDPGYRAFIEDYGQFVAKHGKGRCVNCGFLSKMGVDSNHLDQFWEVERATLNNRATGNVFESKAGALKSWPECYVWASDLGREVLAALGYDGWGRPEHPPAGEQWPEPDNAAKAVIDKDRRCRRWVAWTMHRSPEWHLDQARADKTNRRNQRLQWALLFVGLMSLLASGIQVWSILKPPTTVTLIQVAPTVEVVPTTLVTETPKPVQPAATALPEP